MEKKPAYLKRRTILSGLAGGIMGSQLPSSWKKPIVEAVVLPAHAETTQCPGSTLVLPGVSTPIGGCSGEDPTYTIYISYDVDDSDICSLIYGVSEQEGAVEKPGRLLIVIGAEYFRDTYMVYINLYGTDCGIGHIVSSAFEFGRCGQTTSITNGYLECTFIGATGREYIAACTIDDDGEKIFLSDILLTPK